MPYILEKIVEKIVVMPQIVEVLKYVHEVIEKEDLEALNIFQGGVYYRDDHQGGPGNNNQGPYGGGGGNRGRLTGQGNLTGNLTGNVTGSLTYGGNTTGTTRYTTGNTGNYDSSPPRNLGSTDYMRTSKQQGQSSVATYGNQRETPGNYGMTSVSQVTQQPQQHSGTSSLYQSRTAVERSGMTSSLMSGSGGIEQR